MQKSLIPAFHISLTHMQTLQNFCIRSAVERKFVACRQISLLKVVVTRINHLVLWMSFVAIFAVTLMLICMKLRLHARTTLVETYWNVCNPNETYRNVYNRTEMYVSLLKRMNAPVSCLDYTL